jgi:DNA segregation ATPase FtsK/SpoIIIE, S-DNA-T family
MSSNAQARPVSHLKGGRTNEIVGILLLASSALLILCLLSYNPNDPSWNSSETGSRENLIGFVGANVAAALFQTFGLAAFIIPVLWLTTAIRRFRTGHFFQSSSRALGLVTILLSVSSLLALSGISPLFDMSVPAGGLIGSIIAAALSGALNGVGAAIILFALCATGILLSTNLSFAAAVDYLLLNFSGRFTLLSAVPLKLRELIAGRLNRSSSTEERVEVVEESKESTKPKTRKVDSEAVVIRNITNATTEELLKNLETQLPIDRTHFEEERPVIVPMAEVIPMTTKRAARSAAATSGTQKQDVVAAMMESASVVRKEITEDPEAEVLGDLALRDTKPRKVQKPLPTNYNLPSLEYLNPAQPRLETADEELLDTATRVAEKCKEFNVTGQIKHICPGPVVTTYEFKPDPGVKYSRVTGLVDDLCLALKAESVRIDRLPGKSHVGIEVPNSRRETIVLREVVESRQFVESSSKLTIALGKTIDGLNYVADLAKMPHLLIAGATGAGKSVCVNSLVVSILYKAQPDEVKFIMVDPKHLELGLYADIPHLATPIITDPKRAAYAMKWAVAEMERRYKELAGWGVRNIDGYNAEVIRRNTVEEFDPEGNAWKPLPYIVIIIDELADLMMVSGHEVEEAIQRLAQMARAVGIHLVLATQRPSVDVITGVIKANFPSRISFRVSSKVDSRTIIDTNGAEQLLGRGDMLFLPPGTSRLVRVHGAYVDETEIGKIVSHIKEQSSPEYDETITRAQDEEGASGSGDGAHDELFEDALRICVEMKRASTSVLQRRLRIGYGRAAAILDQMEREGYIGQADGARPRPVLSRAFETVSHWEDLSDTDET